MGTDIELAQEQFALTLLMLLACDSGTREQDEFEEAMKWIGGEDWRDKTPAEWAKNLADNHDVYIEEYSFGDALKHMFDAYKEREKDA